MLEMLWKLNQLLNTKADGVVPPGNAPWDLFPPFVHDSLVPKCRKGCSWNKRNGPSSESFFAFSCVLFGCTHRSSPSLVSWQGAGTVRRVAFASSLGVYQRSQNSIPYHKNTGLQMTFGWNKAIRSNLLGPLKLPSLPRTRLAPSSLVAFVSGQCFCVCEKAGSGQGPLYLKHTSGQWFLVRGVGSSYLWAFMPQVISFQICI